MHIESINILGDSQKCICVDDKQLNPILVYILDIGASSLFKTETEVRRHLSRQSSSMKETLGEPPDKLLYSEMN